MNPTGRRERKRIVQLQTQNYISCHSAVRKLTELLRVQCVFVTTPVPSTDKKTISFCLAQNWPRGASGQGAGIKNLKTGHGKVAPDGVGATLKEL